MSVIAWPSCAKIRTITPTLTQPAQVNRSEFTSRRQVTILAVAPRWSFKVEPYPAVDPSQQRAWIAFLIGLQGVVNSFRLPVTLPQFEVDPGLTVAGANQAGYGLSIRATRSNKIQAGMMLSVQDIFMTFMADVSFSAGQTFTVPVLPYLRQSPDNGAPIGVMRPTALVSLKAPDAGTWTLDNMRTLGTSFECEESF